MERATQSGVVVVQRGTGHHGEWTLAPVVESEHALLAQMLQLYLYDFSEMDHFDVGEDGLFGYLRFDRYLDERQPDYFALILRISGNPAGFALIDNESSLEGGAGHYYIHEFHVMRAYRRGGYGQAMAWAVFDRLPGKWQIVQIGPNAEAQVFWRRVIDRYTGGRYTERILPGNRCSRIVQEFDTVDRAIR